MHHIGRRWFPLLVALLLTAIATLLGRLLFDKVSIAGIAMLYLLFVLFAAIQCRLYGALATSFFSFLALNYFFVEPLYTFHVASAQALLELLVFLAVSVTTVSLTERLKQQTQQAVQAQHYAESARLLAEQLLKLNQHADVVQQGCQSIALSLNAKVALVALPQHVYYVTDPAADLGLDWSAIRWVVNHQQAMGVGTGNWPEQAYWCLPLVGDSISDALWVLPNDKTEATLDQWLFLKGLVDQLSLALALLQTRQKEQQAIRLAERESVQHALLASLSHDFRTPLTTIIGAVTTLKEQSLVLTADQSSLLSLIEVEASQLVDDAENILSLSRLEALGVSALQADWQSAEEIVGILAARVARRYPAMRMRTDVDASLPLLFVDINLVTQAMMNLIENAIKYPIGNEPIVLLAEQRENVIVLSIKDGGVGLPEHVIQQVSEKFVRGREESAHAGFGLGLTICEAVAKLHEGRLCFDRPVSGGFVASMCFPIKPMPIDK